MLDNNFGDSCEHHQAKHGVGGVPNRLDSGAGNNMQANRSTNPFDLYATTGSEENDFRSIAEDNATHSFGSIDQRLKQNYDLQESMTVNERESELRGNQRKSNQADLILTKPLIGKVSRRIATDTTKQLKSVQSNQGIRPPVDPHTPSLIPKPQQNTSKHVANRVAVRVQKSPEGQKMASSVLLGESLSNFQIHDPSTDTEVCVIQTPLSLAQPHESPGSVLSTSTPKRNAGTAFLTPIDAQGLDESGPVRGKGTSTFGTLRYISSPESSRVGLGMPQFHPNQEPYSVMQKESSPPVNPSILLKVPPTPATMKNPSMLPKVPPTPVTMKNPSILPKVSPPPVTMETPSMLPKVSPPPVIMEDPSMLPKVSPPPVTMEDPSMLPKVSPPPVTMEDPSMLPKETSPPVTMGDPSMLPKKPSPPVTTGTSSVSPKEPSPPVAAETSSVLPNVLPARRVDESCNVAAVGSSNSAQLGSNMATSDGVSTIDDVFQALNTSPDQDQGTNMRKFPPNILPIEAVEETGSILDRDEPARQRPASPNQLSGEICENAGENGLPQNGSFNSQKLFNDGAQMFSRIVTPIISELGTSLSSHMVRLQASLEQANLQTSIFTSQPGASKPSNATTSPPGGVEGFSMSKLFSAQRCDNPPDKPTGGDSPDLNCAADATPQQHEGTPKDKGADNGLTAESLEDLYSCPICLDLFCTVAPREVVRCGQCAQLFCSSCLDDALVSTSYTCPLCRKSPFPIERHYETERIVSAIPGDCTFAIAGCQVALPRGELDEHEANCTFNPDVSCLLVGKPSAGGAVRNSEFPDPGSSARAPDKAAHLRHQLPPRGLAAGHDNTPAPWACAACTFENHAALAECEICQTPRQGMPGASNGVEQTSLVACPSCSVPAPVARGSGNPDGMMLRCQFCAHMFALVGPRTRGVLRRGSPSGAPAGQGRSEGGRGRVGRPGRGEVGGMLGSQRPRSHRSIKFEWEIFIQVPSKVVFKKWKPMLATISGDRLLLFAWYDFQRVAPSIVFQLRGVLVSIQPKERVRVVRKFRSRRITEPVRHCAVLEIQQPRAFSKLRLSVENAGQLAALCNILPPVQQRSYFFI